jgi:hypothetical protein
LIPAANFAETGKNFTDNPADPATFTGFTGGTLANVSLNQGSADVDVEVTAKDVFTAITSFRKTFGKNRPPAAPSSQTFRISATLVTVSGSS